MKKRKKLLTIGVLAITTSLFILTYILYNHIHVKNNQISKDKQTIESDMINSFNEHYNYFSQIAQYAIETNGSFRGSSISVKQPRH